MRTAVGGRLYHKALRRKRLRRGWSQKRVAEEAGCLQTAVSHFELLDEAPGIETIERLSLALDIPLSRLLDFRLVTEVSACYRHPSERTKEALEVFTERAKERALSFGGMNKSRFPLGPEDLYEMTGKLETREYDVIKWRYGLDDGFTYTLDEIGFKLHVSKERVRQIELKALRKLQRAACNLLTAEEREYYRL